MALAAERDLGDRVGDMLLDFLYGLAVDQRPDDGARLEAVADLERRDRVGQLAGSAALAASIARRVSSAPMFGTVPSCLPVAGSLTARVLPLSAPIQAPSI